MGINENVVEDRNEVPSLKCSAGRRVPDNVLGDEWSPLATLLYFRRYCRDLVFFSSFFNIYISRVATSIQQLAF